MPQAGTARTNIYYVKETSWGQVPAGPPTLNTLRTTGHRLRPSKQTVISQEIREDLQIPDIIEVFQGAEGQIPFEVSYGALDDLIEGMLWSAWTTNTVTGASDITFDAAGKTITSAGSPSFDTKFSVGQYIKVSATSSNNGFYKISAVTATVITVEEALANENNTSAQIDGSMIRNGTTETSYVFERKFADITQFMSYTGMELSGMSLDLRERQIVTGNLDLIGKLAARATSTVGDGSPNAAPTNEVFNASKNVGSITEGGTALSTALQAIGLQIRRDLGARGALGNKHAIGIRPARLQIQGRVTAYFEDGTLFDKVINHDGSSLHFRITDAAGNALFATLPSVKYTATSEDAGGVDQDVLEELEIGARRDPTTDCMIQFDRFAA